jgi:hypothetical protein
LQKTDLLPNNSLQIAWTIAPSYGMVDDFRKLLDVEVPKRAQYYELLCGISKLRTILSVIPS